MIFAKEKLMGDKKESPKGHTNIEKLKTIMWIKMKISVITDISILPLIYWIYQTYIDRYFNTKYQ